MKIQLNTDVHIDGNEALAAQVGATVEQALDRFSEHITRVEVHLADPNGNHSAGRNGQQDHRCVLEARLEGRQPVAVTAHAATLEQVVQGAAQKLAHLLGSTLGRLHEHRGPHGKRASDPAGPSTEPAPR